MSITLIIALVGLTLAILAAINAIDLYQKRLQALARERQRLQTELETLEQITIATERTLPGTDVMRQLLEEMIDRLQLLEKLERDDPAPLRARVSRLRERLATLTPPRALNRLCASDAEIARLQQLLHEAEQILRRRQGRGALEAGQLRSLLETIEWARLQVSALSLVAAGYRARERDRVLDARHFYRKAQTLLQQSINPEPQRLEMVRQLGELVRLERRYLDPALFPEGPSEAEVAASSSSTSGTTPANSSSQSATASKAPSSELSRQ